MKIGARALLSDLEQKTNELLDAAQDYSLYLTETQMFWSPEEGEWTIAHCLEHLNLLGDAYIPQFESLVETFKGKKNPPAIFKSGWLGEIYVNTVKLKDSDDLDKLTALEKYDPAIRGVRNGVLNEFIDQQKHFLKILKKSGGVNLRKIKIKLPNSWFKVSLGDGYRWFTEHNARHIYQANQIYKVLRG